MIYFDKYSYFTKLKNTHPAEKFVFSVGSIIIASFSKSIVLSFCVFFTVSLLIVFFAKIKLTVYLKSLSVPLYFLVPSCIVLAFSSIKEHSIIMLPFLNLAISHKSLINSIFLLFKSLSIVSLLYFLILTTSLTEILNIFTKLKFPKLLIEIASLTYRFIFILLDCANNIYISQNSRCGYGTIKNSFKSLGYLITNLFSISLQKSNLIYNSLESRCYNGEFNFLQKKYLFSLKNILFIVIFDVILILGLIISRLKNIL
ncbi:MAG: cobalt ECF transporter T component CbiQ [Spirochaetes bacterium GWD1_27_9]|nr:MAG: cobalt ECF transporter T component CbiQ [Spirochaetes bacterium GWB1_27_13]OHD25636.1 MAG: cobalt ECF transporter T component CbiQ [Spirochaetes bacterium GWC1_27_15]OHD36163.1 MAG: cobalt ECF transporter T component CbiQ [Spirochaetes bacterium GWD1_27_9]